MCIRLLFSFFMLFLSAGMFGQDTVHVRKPHADDDRNCRLELCSKKGCFTDSMPAHFLQKDSKLELRINEECNTKKKSDVFVSSFELNTEINGISQSLNAQSSFFTDPQLRMITGLKPGDHFNIQNVVVHAPDGFRKMENLQIIIK
jgi:hypothetical protein